VGAVIAGATYAWITGDDRRHMDVEGTTMDASNAARDEQGRPVLND
jgi:aquaporin Z